MFWHVVVKGADELDSGSELVLEMLRLMYHNARL